MTLIRGKLINWKLHKNYEFDTNGKSIIIVGESGTGKSELIEAMNTMLLKVPFDENALSEGAETGLLEFTFDFGDGHQYTIKRRLNRKAKKGSLRFEVYDENGGEHSLKPLLEKIFGIAYIKNYFDYTEFFYRCKSTDARTDYFIKTIGGDDVLLNSRKIKAQTTERGQLTTQAETFTTLINENPALNPETLLEDKELYKEPKTSADALLYPAYVEISNEFIDEQKLKEDYDLVMELHGQFDEKVERDVAIDNEIADFQKKIAELKSEKKDIAKWKIANPKDLTFEKELQDKLATAYVHNLELEPLLEEAQVESVQWVNKFNQLRFSFNSGLEHLEKLNLLNERRQLITESIESLEEANRTIFLERLPIPEISVEDDTIMYLCDDGIKRELCFPNINKGRSIRVAAQIQRATNPGAKNTLVISEAQSLGSNIFDIMNECNEFGVQYIMEFTEIKKKLSIIFEEEFVKSLNK